MDKIEDIVQPSYNNHKKNFDDFTVCVMWKQNDVLVNMISVSSTITLEKPHLFRPSMIELPIVERVSPLDFLDTFDKNINDEVDEINILIVSDLRDMTFLHYMTKPK